MELLASRNGQARLEAKFRKKRSSMITSALHLKSQAEHPGPLLGYINAGYCMTSVVASMLGSVALDRSAR
jgi:hypothetical protein